MSQDTSLEFIQDAVDRWTGFQDDTFRYNAICYHVFITTPRVYISHCWLVDCVVFHDVNFWYDVTCSVLFFHCTRMVAGDWCSGILLWYTLILVLPVPPTEFLYTRCCEMLDCCSEMQIPGMVMIILNIVFFSPNIQNLLYKVLWSLLILKLLFSDAILVEFLIS